MTYAAWRERFLEAVDERFYPAWWIDHMVERGGWSFWENEDAAILAEIKRYPSGVKEVHGLVAAGELAAIKALVLKAEEWGRSQGAITASIESRPEWARVMRDRGYEVEQVRIAKEL